MDPNSTPETEHLDNYLRKRYGKNTRVFVKRNYAGMDCEATFVLELEKDRHRLQERLAKAEKERDNLQQGVHRLQDAIRLAVPCLDRHRDLSDEDMSRVHPDVAAQRTALRACQAALIPVTVKKANPPDQPHPGAVSVAGILHWVHVPGNPMPCPPRSKVYVVFEGGSACFPIPFMAGDCHWGADASPVFGDRVTAWRYAKDI